MRGRGTSPWQSPSTPVPVFHWLVLSSLVQVCHSRLRRDRRIGASVFCLVAVGIAPELGFGVVICEGGDSRPTQSQPTQGQEFHKFVLLCIVRVCHSRLRRDRRIALPVFCLVVAGVTPKVSYGAVICEPPLAVKQSPSTPGREVLL